MESEMKIAEIEYQKRLAPFKKYRKNGVDIAFRCDNCGKLIFQSDVLFGIGCRRCRSSRVRPITSTLTKFGVYYCLFWNYIHEKYYIKKFGHIEGL